MSLLENVAENFSAQEKSVSQTYARRATELLKMGLQKAPVVTSLKKHDPVARIHPGRTRKQHRTRAFNN